MWLPLQHTFGLNSTLKSIAAGEFEGAFGSKIRMLTMPQAQPSEPVFVIPQPPPPPPGTLSVWNVPSNLTASFSALCWNFAVSLMNKTDPGVPLGLISSNVGGTTIQAWSEKEKLLAACGNVTTPGEDDAYYGGLYNGMIAPLLNMSVRGFLWCKHNHQFTASKAQCVC
jgi:sialate O-acetylesterase